MAYDLGALLEKFLQQGNWTIEPGKGGMNNTTRFVSNGKDRYVLRIYETHQDVEKVIYEHNVLIELGEMQLPFGIPKPVSLINGETVGRTDDGRLSALFHYMEGITPNFDEVRQLYSFGLTAGNLSKALQNVKIGLKPVYRPYYEIENTHPKCSLEDVIYFCEKPTPDFSQYSEELLEVAAQLSKFRESIPELKKLPHQLIHGDLNASNVLADKVGNIRAVLDFEFVTEDLRVMELCVCLSEIINIKQSEAVLWEKLTAFLEGYGSALKLSAGEIAVIPVLIMLRRLDVFIHFLGRFRDGIDTQDVVNDQINNAFSQARWLNENEQKLSALCNTCMFIN